MCIYWYGVEIIVENDLNLYEKYGKQICDRFDYDAIDICEKHVNMKNEKDERKEELWLGNLRISRNVIEWSLWIENIVDESYKGIIYDCEMICVRRCGKIGMYCLKWD